MGTLEGWAVVTASPIKDSRGSFCRLFCESALAPFLEGRKLVQINHSVTMKKGGVRGLHFQNPPHAEMKLIRCLKGRVWDVAVDLRPDSPTRYQWAAVELSAENNNMVIIPEGFAHGFQVLEEGSELLYLHTALYHPQAEGRVHPEDPNLRILWPLPITELSQKDAGAPFL